MKKLCVLFALAVLSFAACNDDKATEKELLDEVIKVHDEVMGKEEYLIRNKMKIDTILTAGLSGDKYSIEEKTTMSAVRFKLIKADEAMSKWMERFDPELKGKSHEEKIKYYTEQKKEVVKIDSIFTAVIEGSDNYLKGLKK